MILIGVPRERRSPAPHTGVPVVHLIGGGCFGTVCHAHTRHYEPAIGRTTERRAVTCLRCLKWMEKHP